MLKQLAEYFQRQFCIAAMWNILIGLAIHHFKCPTRSLFVATAHARVATVLSF